MKFVSANGKVPMRDLLDKHLLPNQREALQVTEGYLKSQAPSQCLVQMPTGSGKTAIISVLAQLLASHPRVLVIAPWKNLTKQLWDEIDEDFWTKSDLIGSVSRREVRVFTPNTFQTAIADIAAGGVLLCTNSTLQALHGLHDPSYQALRGWVDLVLVDEGHREPATSWAAAIRGLQKPTILFTATPYRNDSRLFQFESNHRYVYTYGRAVTDGVIRKVDFHSLRWTRGTHEVRDFLDQVQEYRRKASEAFKLPLSEVRVLIRCATGASVKRVARAIRGLEISDKVIGVHHGFSAQGTGYLHQEVPRLDTNPAAEECEYWIHQWKLMEGHDEPRLRLLAIFEGFPNARNVVQQVGRIVRNPGFKTGQSAIVIAHEADQQKEFWDAYVDYEDEVQELLDAGEEVLSAQDYIRMQRAHQQRYYIGGDFRKNILPSDVQDPRQHVRMILSVAALRLDTAVSLDKIIGWLEGDMVGRDGSMFGMSWKSGNEYLCMYELLTPSDKAAGLYVESRMAYSYLFLKDRLLMVADSENALPERLRRASESLGTEELARAFPQKNTAVGQISLVNGDLSNHRIRRKLLTAASLDDVPPELSDYHHIYTTARGRVEHAEGSRYRYVGFTRGRISQGSASPVDFETFRNWLVDLVDALEDVTVESVDCLGRFAEPARYDPSFALRHVLLDLEDLDLEDQLMVSEALPANHPDFWAVDPSGVMFGQLGSKNFKTVMKWNPQRRRFDVESDGLATVKLRDPETGKQVHLDDYLTKTQSFRAVLSGPNDRDLLYTERRFFRANQNPWRGGARRFSLLNIVRSSALLANCPEEKFGIDHQPWTPGSVFHAVTALQDPTGLFNLAGLFPDVLLCYDMGEGKHGEFADFFAYVDGDNRKLIAVHCKAGKGAGMAPSEFHELCGQTVRYLAFFNPDDADTKPKPEKVARPWKLKKKSMPRLVHDSSNTGAVEACRRIRELTRDPACQKEVWMVMGQGLSLAALTHAINNPPPAIGVRHMIYLLQSTWASVSGVGASLRVFCSP